jgi:hypothetical protein
MLTPSITCRNSEILYLEFNRFEGTIPTEIGKLNKLSKPHFGALLFESTHRHLIYILCRLLADMWFQHNMFTGVIPSELGSLSKLGELQVSCHSSPACFTH